MSNPLRLAVGSRDWGPDADASARAGHRPPENRLLDTATGVTVLTDHRSPAHTPPG